MPRHAAVSLLGLLTVAFLAACGADSEPVEPADLAIVGARLIDGTGTEPVADSIILIDGGRVRTAGPSDAVEVPDGTEVVDAAGKTVIPGFVDLHAHYGGPVEATEQALRSQLYYGVTTTRSIGSDTPEKVALMLEAHAGRPDLPRAFTAGLGFSYPGGFNSSFTNTPTTEEDARAMVREQAALGVHYTKMWINEVAEPGLKIPPEIRAAIVDESYQNGLIPVAHINEEADGVQLLEVGLNEFMHTTVRTFGPGGGVPMEDPVPSQAFLDLCLEKSCGFAPTLSIVQNNWHFAEHPELLEDPELRAVMNPRVLERWSNEETRAAVLAADGFEGRKLSFRHMQDFVKTLHDHGIKVALGTDSGTPNVPMGWGTHHELELYVEAGLTPMETLVAATATGAGRVPPVGEADFGTLTAGMSADLIVLNADPLADIRNTLEIDRVMLRGEWVDRDALLQSE
ncbi:MAG: amidohydrolase family protein [Holophagales bacterium]|nr:amidohydrolase family protein [Holophagales bacterium]MYD23504.1 amidohydrolase family protein [Holophagales bacterium]MYI31428.1 amidohydrolase family protein [Holophagales bacterium]